MSYLMYSDVFCLVQLLIILNRYEQQTVRFLYIFFVARIIVMSSLVYSVYNI